jgi:hypothetical protein
MRLHGVNTGTRGGDRKGGSPNKERGDGMGDGSLQSHSGENLNPKMAKDRSNVPKGGEARGVALTAYPVWTPLNVTAKDLSLDQSPTTPEDVAIMMRVPYRAAIGSIMYASMCTRPDITFSINRLSQFSTNPGAPHWAAAKHVLTYLNSTRTYHLTLGGVSSHITLTGSANSDYASDTDNKKSVSGYVFFLGKGAVTWSSKKQASLTTSSCEATPQPAMLRKRLSGCETY